MPGIIERLQEACNKAIAKGQRIKPGSWGIQEKDGVYIFNETACCPLGALAEGRLCLSQNTTLRAVREMTLVIATILDVSPHWVSGFQAGFDAVPMATDRTNGWYEGYDVGQALLKEYGHAASS